MSRKGARQDISIYSSHLMSSNHIIDDDSMILSSNESITLLTPDSTGNEMTTSRERRKSKGFYDKNINRGRWTKEEDEKLKNLVLVIGDNKWSEVASYFQDRSDVQCQQRWDKVVNPSLVKGPWTKEVCDYISSLSLKSCKFWDKYSFVCINCGIIIFPS